MDSFFYDPKYVNFMYFSFGLAVGYMLNVIRTAAIFNKLGKSYTPIETFGLQGEAVTELTKGWGRYLLSMKGKATKIVVSADEALDLLTSIRAADVSGGVETEFSKALMNEQISFGGVPLEVQNM